MDMIIPININDDNFVTSNVPESIGSTTTAASGSIVVNIPEPASGQLFLQCRYTTPDGTFQLDTQIFTFVTARTATGEITVSGNVATMAQNTVNAINADVSGITASINSYVYGGPKGTTRIAAYIDIFYDTPGIAGNSIVFKHLTGSNHEELTHDGQTASVLTGGAVGNGVPAVTDTFEIAGQTFTFVVTRSGLGEVTLVLTRRIDLAQNISDAINLDISGLVSASKGSSVILLTSQLEGTLGNEQTLVSSIPSILVSGVGYLEGGEDAVAGYQEWNDTTTFAAGDLVVIAAKHRIYESLLAENLAKYPPNYLIEDGDGYVWWLDCGATNRWAMFDNKASTRTEQAESIEVELAPGSIDCVGILGVDGTEVTITMDSSGIVYHRVITVIEDNSNIACVDLPSVYESPTLTVKIANPGAVAACTFLIVGLRKDLGTLLYSPKVELIDYSIKETDDFGNFYITERPYSTYNSYNIAISFAEHIEIKALLVTYRAIPCLFIGQIEHPLTYNFGFIKEWEMSLSNAYYVYLNLEIEGLT